MASLTIRPATLADAADLGIIHYQSWLQTYTGLIDQNFLNQLSAQRSQQRFEVEGCKQFLIALVDGSPAGFCRYCKSRDPDADSLTGEIQAIYLLKEYQQRGIGTALMLYAFDELKKLGMNRVTLWALESNTTAHCFYIKMGFIPDGARKQDPVGAEIRFSLTFSDLG